MGTRRLMSGRMRRIRWEGLVGVTVAEGDGDENGL